MWFKGKQRMTADENINISFENNVASLTLVKAEKSDAGEYICEAKNDAGSQRCSAVLKVKEPATFTEEMEAVNVTAGDTASFECQVTGTPPIKMKCYKDGELLKPSRKCKITFLNNIASLKISSTDVTDAAEYSCQVENDVGSSVCHATLTISDRLVPPSFFRKVKTMDTIIGSTASIDCKCSGSQPMSITWLKGDVELSDGDKCHLRFSDNMATLKLHTVDIADGGDYVCKATNTSGSDACTVTLTIVGE
uniref:Ig-like domain-containing protein n=1 Tax=Eptatretus burgeri TaxID=7764 RepID=A0A8C4WWM6_EPTBU